LNIALEIIAGLGLFVIGIRVLGTYLGQIAGRRMRTLVGRAVGGQRVAMSLGLLLGAVMQHTNAVIFMLANLVQAGVLDTRRALPVIAAANLGATVVVLVASVSLKGAVFVLLALIGLAFKSGLHEAARWRALVWAALGIGLLFLGVDYIRTAATELKASAWLREAAGPASLPLALHFGLGFVVTLAVQSSSVITIVAMTVAKAGVFDLSHGAAVVLGACLASGFTAFTTGPRLHGSARQLLLFQMVLKVAGVTAAAALLLLEQVADVPMLFAAASMLGLTAAQTLAMLYVVVHVLSDLVVHPLHGPLDRWLHRRAPHSDEERLARPSFLNDDSLAEPETALLLLEREQRALLQGLTDYVDGLREEGGALAVRLEARHTGSQRLLAECQEFLTALSDRHRSHELLEDFMRQRSRLELGGSLLETLWNFQAEVAQLKGVPALQGLVHAILESTHLLLMQLAEAAESKDAEELEALALMTQDRSDTMDQVRRRGMALSAQLSTQLPDQARRSLFEATMYFERLVWLIGRYTRLLQAPAVLD